MKDTQSVSIHLDPTQTKLLLVDANQAYHTKVEDLLLTALALTMKKWTQQPSFVIHMEGHGRETIKEGIDLSRTVGWFTTLFPVILSVPEQPLSYVVKSIKETLRAIPKKGIGYGILRYLTNPSLRRELEVKSDICFNYLGQFDQQTKLETIQFSPMPTGEQIGPNNSSNYLLNINSIVINGKFQMVFTYPKSVLTEETIKQIAKQYKENLLRLIDHCLEKEHEEWTPSDFAAKDLTFEELDAVLQALKENGD